MRVVMQMKNEGNCTLLSGAIQLYHTFCFLIRPNFKGFWEANPEMDAVFAGWGGGS